MEAFKKWMKENGLDTKAGWKAALEELLKIMREQKPEDVQEIIEMSGFDAVHRENYGEDNGKRN